MRADHALFGGGTLPEGYICVYVCIRENVCKYVCVSEYRDRERERGCVCVFENTLMCVFERVCMCICESVYVYVCIPDVCARVHVYV